ncbi:MAG: element excision factor XisI family protein [Bacteroidota bacterium]
MDKIRAVKEYLNEVVSYWDDTNATLQENYQRHSLVFDDKRKSYLVLWHGWHGKQHQHRVLIHLDVIGDYIWLQRNTTEEEVVDELAKKGINPNDVILGFVEPWIRQKMGMPA